uniref:MFS domain-containing protein n=1 Tax=Soboliphyme baturini TaxID=241478 RepID=A0A183J9S1_9BILA
MLNYGLYGRCAPNFSQTPSKGELPKADPTATFDYGYCITRYSWLPILGMIVYLSSFSVKTQPQQHYLIYIQNSGLGPIPWTINAEIYPNWARSIGNSASTFTNWTFNILISFTFLTLSRAITRQGAFFLYGCICVVGLIFFYLLVPETKGMRIEDIEECLQTSWIYKSKKSGKRSMNLNIVYPEKSSHAANPPGTPELTIMTSF